MKICVSSGMCDGAKKEHSVNVAAFVRLFALNDSRLSLCVQDDLTTCIHHVLEEAEEKWNKGEEPTREDGCFVSTVAYDIIQVKKTVRRCLERCHLY